MSNNDDLNQVEWTEEKREEFRRKRRVKNLAVLGLLVAFVVIVYFVALVRMGGG